LGLTEEEVARRAGTTPERVRELVDVGVLRPRAGSDAPFSSGDALRVQLVEELAAFDITPERVAAAMAEGALSLSYLDRFPDPPPRSARTYTEVCEKLGIPFELLDRIYAGFGLRRPRPDERVREDDLAIVSDLPILFESGLTEDEVLRAARVWGEGPRRVAQHQVHSFHELIEEPFRQQGLTDDQALDAA
jgi:Adenylate cyclase regulatory domain